MWRSREHGTISHLKSHLLHVDMEYCWMCPDQWSWQGNIELKDDGAQVVGCKICNIGGWVSPITSRMNGVICILVITEYMDLFIELVPEIAWLHFAVTHQHLTVCDVHGCNWFINRNFHFQEFLHRIMVYMIPTHV
jgi:hypothetical protein